MFTKNPFPLHSDHRAGHPLPLLGIHEAALPRAQDHGPGQAGHATGQVDNATTSKVLKWNHQTCFGDLAGFMMAKTMA